MKLYTCSIFSVVSTPKMQGISAVQKPTHHMIFILRYTMNKEWEIDFWGIHPNLFNVTHACDYVEFVTLWQSIKLYVEVTLKKYLGLPKSRKWSKIIFTLVLIITFVCNFLRHMGVWVRIQIEFGIGYVHSLGFGERAKDVLTWLQTCWHYPWCSRVGNSIIMSSSAPYLHINEPWIKCISFNSRTPSEPWSDS